MSTSLTQIPRPRPGVMYGVTHDQNSGLAIIRDTKTIKISIGIPKGRAAYVYINHEKKWVIRFGAWTAKPGSTEKKWEMKTVGTFDTRDECEKYFYAHRKEAAESNRPQKLPFFTFARRSVIDVDGKSVEQFEPDFSTIEAHGAMPKELGIRLFADNPLSTNEYAMWSASEKKCYGDGLVGMRVLSMASTPEEKALAIEAQKSGEKYFPILTGCRRGGCKYWENSTCKANQTLNLQLENAMRIGSTPYFTTTSEKSAAQISSAIASLHEKAGKNKETGSPNSIVGIGLKMILSPWRSNKNGQPGQQYSVHLELRDEENRGISGLRRKLLEDNWEPLEATKLLADPSIQDAEFQDVPMSAQAMHDEFYPESDDDSEDAPPATTNAPATQAASAAKVTEIGEALAKAAAPPPPASNVVSISPDKAPWADADKPRVRMTEMYQAMLKEIGKPAYDALLTQYGLNTGSPLKHDDPASLACYRAMEMRAKESKSVERTEAPTTEDRPLF